MFRYLKLYGHFMNFSFKRAMVFRFDFTFRIVMDIVFYVTSLAFYDIIYSHTDLLADWTREKAFVFASAFFVIDAIYMVVFANNTWWLSIFINRGDLDYYLVRPVSSLFFLSLRDFAANSVANVVIAVGILAWALSQLPDSYHFGQYILFALSILGGVLIYYYCHMLMTIPTFWLHSNEGLRQVHWGLARFAEKPDQILKGWARRVLTTILPFATIASFPTRLFFDPLDPGILIHFLLVISLMTAFIIAFWRLGLRSYSSASS